MVAVLLPVLLLVLSHSTIGEPTFETIPLRFESVIQRLREFYQNYPDIVNDLVNNPFAKIRPELLLNNRTSSQNQSSDCERDLEILISAASQRQLWALKVLDAWGKPLPSGILKGNIFWLGNYDECLNPLYQINNKSFLQQPINTQYCALQSTGPNFFDKIYQTPWCRISPYAFGLLTGFVVVSTGRNYRLNTIVRVIGNILATVLGLVCIFSTYGDYILVPGLSRASLVAYQVLSRVGWSMSISWLIFICSINQGGIVNRILSFSIWTPLARLNYAAYLIHSTVIFVTIFNQSVPLYYQSMTFLNNYVSILCFSYLAAIVVVIFFETPFFVLEKKFLKR
ncbi:unnamed protein product [Rotaria socialis]